MFQKNANGEFYCTLCGKLLRVHTREEIRVCGPKAMAFQKNAAGEFYCTSCGKRDRDHTREEMRKCAPDAIIQDNDQGFSYSMLDIEVAYNPDARKRKGQ